MTWLFRFFTLISVTYLVIDRNYETFAVITASASDPADPFYYPFSLTNNSHIFYMRNINWGCKVVKLIYENDNEFGDTNIITNDNKAMLSPGATANVYCNKGGIVVRGMKLKHAVVRMQAIYHVNFLGFIPIDRQSDPVTFTWYDGPTESKRQWIRGEL